METTQAFIMGEMNRDKEMMVFDWEKAAKLIVLNSPHVASAGLSSDWEWTGGDIWLDGKPVPRENTYTYLASTWATPELRLDGETYDCFVMQSDRPDWGSDTYWPKEALEIVGT